MQKKKLFLTLGFMLLLVLVLTNTAWADRLAEAINSAPPGSDPGQIPADGEPGYLGIPGAPQVNLIIGFLWAVWVGWIFSTVGAFGGIMAGVGHISIFGLGNYANTFKNTAPALDKMVTDSIRVSNQWLVGTSAAISSFNYWRMGRLVLPIGLSLGLGSLLGSYLIPWLSAGKISLQEYIGYFGLFVFLLGGWLLYETTPRGQRGKKAAKEASQRYEESVRKQKEGAKIDEKELGVKLKSLSFKRIYFTFYGVEFSFNPLIPFIGGFLIAGLASFLGVGGGFLLVPFLTSVAGLPMYIVAGTSALTVLIGMVVSIFTYMVVKLTPVFWPLIGIELLGILVGSTIGPRTSKYIPEVYLKRIFIVLAFYVGLRYVTKGFLGYSIVPPF